MCHCKTMNLPNMHVCIYLSISMVKYGLVDMHVLRDCSTIKYHALHGRYCCMWRAIIFQKRLLAFTLSFIANRGVQDRGIKASNRSKAKSTNLDTQYAKLTNNMDDRYIKVRWLLRIMGMEIRAQSWSVEPKCQDRQEAIAKAHEWRSSKS